MLAVEIEHRDTFEIEDAVNLMRLFLREKDEELATAWPKQRLRDYIVKQLSAAGQDTSFLSKSNLYLFQQSFGPMFRDLDKEHPRMSQTAKDVVEIDPATFSRQYFSESSLKEHGTMFFVETGPPPFTGHEANLWGQYQKAKEIAQRDVSLLNDDARAIVSKINQVGGDDFKLPWNVLYVSHEPERVFCELLFANAGLWEAILKMPNQGGYSFPYSYKPARTAKTHVVNENFNPDYFIRLRDSYDILVVEVKSEGDDSNRNRAKYRDGQEHFRNLNVRLSESGQPWRYSFYFLSPEDYTHFFRQVREGQFAGWKSGLMQELSS